MGVLASWPVGCHAHGFAWACPASRPARATVRAAEFFDGKFVVRPRQARQERWRAKVPSSATLPRRRGRPQNADNSDQNANRRFLRQWIHPMHAHGDPWAWHPQSNACSRRAAGGAPGAGGFALVPYLGHAGRFSFITSVTGDGTNLPFVFTTHGFGKLGEGLGYYGPVAVMAFARKLAQKRTGDTDFRLKLVLTACLCGRIHLDRKITLSNRTALAFTAVETALESARQRQHSSG